MTANNTNGAHTDSAHVKAAAFLAKHWPGPESHCRHNFALALGGGLCPAAVPAADAERFMELVVEAAGDEEPDNRIAAVRDSYAMAQQGGRVAGWSAAIKILCKLGRDGEAIIG
jgi:hypothetical protein